MLSFLFRLSTFSTLIYYSFHIDRKEIFSISLLGFLLLNDFLSKYVPIFFFHILFFITFLISFCNLMFHFNSFYSYYLFFYNLFLMLQFLFFYYFMFIPNQRQVYIKNYFIQLPTIQTIEEECYICLENSIEKEEDLKILKCSHIFHTKCLFEWYQQKLIKEYICPVCKKNVFQ